MSKICQKKIALINDLTGFGRCAIAVQLPLISALKVQCCIMPTAILSNHTGFDTFFFDDYTPKMEEYIDKWEKINLKFDGICTGFLGSLEQIGIVSNFIKKFKTEDNIVIIDPVMGDNGKIYRTYTEEMCESMKDLVSNADVITPNLTELCTLLDIEYPTETPDNEHLNALCEELSERGPDKIVVTGLHRGGCIENFVYEKNKIYNIVRVEKIARDRSGTGDVFSAIVSASLVKGEDFFSAVKKAALFINKCLKFTDEIDTPSTYGVCFEEFLTDLK